MLMMLEHKWQLLEFGAAVFMRPFALLVHSPFAARLRLSSRALSRRRWRKIRQSSRRQHLPWLLHQLPPRPPGATMVAPEPPFAEATGAAVAVPDPADVEATASAQVAPAAAAMGAPAAAAVDPKTARAEGRGVAWPCQIPPSSQAARELS